jgi:hypothetical protein
LGAGVAASDFCKWTFKKSEISEEEREERDLGDIEESLPIPTRISESLPSCEKQADMKRRGKTRGLHTNRHTPWSRDG